MDNVNCVYVPNIVEENGKTVRENNLAILHDIPIGTLVEIHCEHGHEENGLRLFVVGHARDNDGEPLYDLSFNKEIVIQIEELKASPIALHPSYIEGMKAAICRGWNRISLKIISPPESE